MDEEECGHLFLEPLSCSSFEEIDQKKVVNMAGDAETKLSKIPDEKSISFTPYNELNIQTIKMKNDLNSWKEVILLAKSILLWDKPWYPEGIVGVITIFFTILWLGSPSLLTTVSMIGLVVTLADYFVPLFAASYFKPENWSKNKDQQFEDICRNYIVYRAKFVFACQNYYKMRTSKPKMFYSCTILALLLMSWIGCKISNLFLSYIVISIVMLLPGLECNGYIKKGKEEFNTRFGGITEKICTTLNGMFGSQDHAKRD